MQFFPVKMKALFAGKKRWTYIVLGDWLGAVSSVY
jgi:hypothetical protein